LECGSLDACKVVKIKHGSKIDGLFCDGSRLGCSRWADLSPFLQGALGRMAIFEKNLKKLFIFLMKKLMDSHLKAAVEGTNL
jgi:hypothetical protein